MTDLLMRHFVVHCGGLGIGAAESVGERAVNPVILVLVGYRERKNFLLIEIGESFQVLSPTSPWTMDIGRASTLILELF